MGLKNAGGSEFRSGSRSVGKQVETWRNTDAIGTRRLNSDVATNTYNPSFEASGGNVEQSPGNGYSYHVFYSPGTFNFKSSSTVDAKILIVAGGGGGGNHSGGGHYCAGGGGAGGLYDLTMPVDDLKGYMTSSPNPVYTHTAAITIGDGGVGGGTPNNGEVGTNGGDSQFGPPTSGITVSGGGGGGGAHSPANGSPGGSGGGGAGTGGGSAGGGASPPIGPQGNPGGSAGKNPSPPQRYAGGGGGAGGAGSPGPASGGEGGPGHGVDWIPATVLTEPTTGDAFGTPGGTPSRYFAGGGGGAPQHCPNGSQPGGEGGGGTGFNNNTTPPAGNGTAWTGGGGGAKSTCDSGSGGANTMTGGSGICIIRVSTEGS